MHKLRTELADDAKAADNNETKKRNVCIFASICSDMQNVNPGDVLRHRDGKSSKVQLL